MKLYPGAGGYHCFGCNAHGSVIDFVAAICGLDALSAVRRINDDFHLALPLDKPQAREGQNRSRETYMLFEAWREKLLKRLNSAYQTGFLALRDKTPETWTDGETLAIKLLPCIEDYADALDSGDMEKQMQIFRNRTEVERLCSRVLSSTPPRSATA